MYANAEIETMPREELAKLQLARLKKTVKWAMDKSAFYRDKFASEGISAEDIQSLSDIRRLPFLTNLELHQVDALTRLTLPLTEILRISYLRQTSGDLLFFYTNGDIAHNIEMMARALVAGGVNRASVVGIQGEMTDSRFLDVQYAVEFLGGAVLPLGTDYRDWLRILELMHLDVIVSTPQLIMQLMIQLQSVGKDIADYDVKQIFCLNDTGLQNLLQRHVMDRSRARVYNFYSAPELGAAGVLYPCEERQGQHVQEDFWYPEVVAFGASEPVEDPNQMGELVLTSLAAEALPLIRYRTGQAVSLRREPCKCGRTFVRVATPFNHI